MTRAILMAALLLAACSKPPEVVTKIERVYPAGPPPGACEPQPAPNVEGMVDWRERAVVYAAAAAAAQGQLRRCDQWIKGWQAERGQ
ncbi:MAG: hypothetical protein KF889_25335 [Alphaproteobacteria bacterium]|nr:hypothetical protein [Alphaproteobacteria bacterium]MCW5739683.1 hypothetical protein [Alphaproteobacteria bacterium]